MAAKHASVCVLPRLSYFSVCFSFKCSLNCRILLGFWLSRISHRVGKVFGASFAVCSALACPGYSLSIVINSDPSTLVVRDASLFMNPAGMAAKHASVWVLPRLSYFSVCFSFKCSLNCRIPLGDQHISISNIEKISFCCFRDCFVLLTIIFIVPQTSAENLRNPERARSFSWLFERAEPTRLFACCFWSFKNRNTIISVDTPISELVEYLCY